MKFFIRNFKLICVMFVGYTIWYVLSAIFIACGISMLKAVLMALGSMIGITFFIIISMFAIMSWACSSARAERDEDYLDGMYVEPTYKREHG